MVVDVVLTPASIHSCYWWPSGRVSCLISGLTVVTLSLTHTQRENKSRNYFSGCMITRLFVNPSTKTPSWILSGPSQPFPVPPYHSLLQPRPSRQLHCCSLCVRVRVCVCTCAIHKSCGNQVKSYLLFRGKGLFPPLIDGNDGGVWEHTSVMMMVSSWRTFVATKFPSPLYTKFPSPLYTTFPFPLYVWTHVHKPSFINIEYTSKDKLVTVLWRKE